MAKKGVKKGKIKSKNFVKKAGATALTLFFLTGTAGVFSCQSKLNDSTGKMRDLDTREAYLVASVRSEDSFMDWYQSRVDICKEALDKDIITEKQFSENISKMSDDEYLLNNLSTIDYLNQKYVAESESIKRERKEAKEQSDKASVKGAGWGALMGVTGLGLITGAFKYAGKKEESAEVETQEEIAM